MTRTRGNLRIARAALAGTLAASLFFAAAGPAQQDLQEEIRKGRSELARLAEQIREAEKRIDALEGQARKAAESLKAVESALSSSEKLLAEYGRQAERLERDIASRNASLEKTRERLAELRSRLAGHVDRIYRRGKPALVGLLFDAEDFGGALRRARYVAAILAAERELVRAVVDEQDRLETEIAALNARQSELGEMRTSQERERARLASLKTKRAGAAKEIEAQQSSEKEAIKRLEARSEELQRLLAELEAARSAPRRASGRRTQSPREAYVPETAFSKLKGKLVWPVRGKLLAKFGAMRHERFGTLTFNSGIDIRANEGQEIVAAAAGQVEFVDWLAGYGKTVILSHGNGYYTVYGHASRILVAPGDRVGGGDGIALAGSTESLRGDCLHFELRQGGQAIDPIPWLRKR